MPQIRRVTVFGGSGFLGRHVVQKLARDGVRVLVASRHARRANYLRPMGVVGQIVQVDIDIRDEAAVVAAVQGADAVVNLVGILFERGKQRFDILQAESAGRIAKAARAAGVRKLIQVSAIGADPQSASRYARSKAAGEQAVRAAFPDAVILRPSIIFGPEDSFFNNFADMARRLPCLPLVGGGHTRFQPVYADDVAAAIAAILETDAPAHPVYELAGPEIYSFRDLLSYTLKETGHSRPLIPLPWATARLAASFLSLLPTPILTQDQITLLQKDNVAGGQLPGLAELGIEPTALELIAPLYLSRYRPGGWFTTRAGLEREAARAQS